MQVKARVISFIFQGISPVPSRIGGLGPPQILQHFSGNVTCFLSPLWTVSVSGCWCPLVGGGSTPGGLVTLVIKKGHLEVPLCWWRWGGGWLDHEVVIVDDRSEESTKAT